MTPAEEAMRDAWLAELWPASRELPVGERLAKRQADWEQRVELSMRPQQSTEDAGVVHKSDAA
jgi:hypothetical protein